LFVHVLASFIGTAYRLKLTEYDTVSWTNITCTSNQNAIVYPSCQSQLIYPAFFVLSQSTQQLICFEYQWTNHIRD